MWEHHPCSPVGLASSPQAAQLFLCLQGQRVSGNAEEGAGRLCRARAPQNVPEMPPDESGHSPFWSPWSLSSDLSLGGGGSLEGAFPTHHMEPPSPGTTGTQQRLGWRREDLLGKLLVLVSTTLSFL